MSRRMNFFVCVVGVVAVLSSASALQATTIYNANDAMYASEKQSPQQVIDGVFPGTNGFGQWSLGSQADGAAYTTFTLFTHHATPRDSQPGWLGWDASSGAMPYFAVNTSASAFGGLGPIPADWWWYRNGDTAMGVKDIGINPAAAEAGVLRWTAPGAGTISTSTIINAGHGTSTNPDPSGTDSGGVDIHLLLNGVSQYDNAFTRSAGVTIVTSDLTVAAGAVLDLVIGDGSNGSDYDESGITSHVITFTPVPEPSTLVLLACGLISLLAYAWRRRR